jgi:phosphohistidine phosphatase
MLTLSLLRHAKAGSDRAGIRDIERPLAPRGERTAPLMGRFIAEHHLEPDLILCSTSRRTRQTLDLVLPELTTQPDVAYAEDLYLAEADETLAVIKARSGSQKRVMIVGHNPGLQELALLLAGAGRKADLSALRKKFPTAGLAVLNFAARDWAGATPGAGMLRLFMAPRILP